MKIIDTFHFHNELKMLKLKLEESFDFVDYFIIVESNKTFSGNSKPLFFENHKQEYKKYLSKIIHLTIQEFPSLTPWQSEHFQRNKAIDAINKLKLKDNDLIIVSDVDEIFNQNVIKEIKQTGISEPSCFELTQYYYNFNCKGFGQETYTYPSKIFTRSDLRQHNDTLQSMRNKRGPNNEMINVIKNGGWHLSFFGDADYIRNKIQSYAHQEFNDPEFTDISKINQRINDCKDIFNRSTSSWRRVEINQDSFLPINRSILLND